MVPTVSVTILLWSRRCSGEKVVDGRTGPWWFRAAMKCDGDGKQSPVVTSMEVVGGVFGRADLDS